MTGFARCEHKNKFCSWSWELKSFNGKGFDVRCRLPRGFEHLEEKIRHFLGTTFKRGSLNINLSISWINVDDEYSINEKALKKVIAAIPFIESQFNNPSSSRASEILTISGVFDKTDKVLKPNERNRVESDILENFKIGLTDLKSTRAREGRQLYKTLKRDLDLLKTLIAKLERILKKQPQLIKARLQKSISHVLSETSEIPRDRLMHELAVLIMKADISEELDRLKTHHAEVETLLMIKGRVGRKLEFMCQELSRETNTLCSKSSDLKLINYGVEIKVVIDRLREQVQNIE